MNNPVDDDDLVIHALNGLGYEYKEVSSALCTLELQDLLVDYENVCNVMMNMLLFLLHMLHIEVNILLPNVAMHLTWALTLHPTNLFHQARLRKSLVDSVTNLDTLPKHATNFMVIRPNPNHVHLPILLYILLL